MGLREGGGGAQLQMHVYARNKAQVSYWSRKLSLVNIWGSAQ